MAAEPCQGRGEQRPAARACRSTRGCGQAPTDRPPRRRGLPNLGAQGARLPQHLRNAPGRVSRRVGGWGAAAGRRGGARGPRCPPVPAARMLPAPSDRPGAHPAVPPLQQPPPPPRSPLHNLETAPLPPNRLPPFPLRFLRRRSDCGLVARQPLHVHPCEGAPNNPVWARDAVGGLVCVREAAGQLVLTLAAAPAAVRVRGQ